MGVPTLMFRNLGESMRCKESRTLRLPCIIIETLLYGDTNEKWPKKWGQQGGKKRRYVVTCKGKLAVELRMDNKFSITIGD